MIILGVNFYLFSDTSVYGRVVVTLMLKLEKKTQSWGLLLSCVVFDK